MTRSRLERVRQGRAGRQGFVYLFLTFVIIVVSLTWGLPAIARIIGFFANKNNVPQVEDDLRPTPPIFSDIPEATFSAQVRIAGYAQPGLDVLLYINGSQIDKQLVSESGTFYFEKVRLTEGDNLTYAYTATSKGTQSEQSKNYTIVVDATKPSVTIDSPKDGETMRGQSQRIVNITGTVSEDGAKVVIGERNAIVMSDNKFSLSYQLLDGEQEIPIKVTDKAGNVGESTLKLRWEQ